MTAADLAKYLEAEAAEAADRIGMLAHRHHVPEAIQAQATLAGALSVIYTVFATEGRQGDFRAFVHEHVNEIVEAAERRS